MCFFGFLRTGEVVVPSDTGYDPAVHLSYEDVKVDEVRKPSYVEVTINASKTDPFRKGVNVYLGTTGVALCPVAAILSYMVSRGSRPGPFFAFSDHRPLTRDRLVKEVRQAMRVSGIDDKLYSGHSFRIGAATTAASCGLQDSLIKMLGRWESAEEQGMVGTQGSRVWWVHRGAGYGGYTEEQGMVGTQRSRVWWVHRGAGYGGYTEEQGMVGTQRSRVWWVHRRAGYGGYTEEQGMVGTQRSRVWWVHRGAGYGGYTGEQGMVGTQRSRVWWVHRGAGYGGYTGEQGMVGTHRSRLWWVHRGAGYSGYIEEQGMVGTHPSYLIRHISYDTSWSDNKSRSLYIFVQCTNLIPGIDISPLIQ